MERILEKLIFWGIRLITNDYSLVKKIILKYRGTPKSVLDLGSGNGYLASLFSPKSYVGYEIDRKLVKESRIAYPKYDFRQADATKLNLERKFDLILVIGVIHHLNDKQFEDVLGVIDKHISRKGKVIILEAISPISEFNLVGRVIRYLDRGEHVRSVDAYKSRIAKLLRVVRTRKLRGGIVDYALFITTKKEY